jgi:hypothetical protein
MHRGQDNKYNWPFIIMWEDWLDFISLQIWKLGPSFTVNGVEFLRQMKDCHFLFRWVSSLVIYTICWISHCSRPTYLKEGPVSVVPLQTIFLKDITSYKTTVKYLNMSLIRLTYLCEGERYKGSKSLNVCLRVDIFGSFQFQAILLKFLFFTYLFYLFNETVTQPVATGCVMVLND